MCIRLFGLPNVSASLAIWVLLQFHLECKFVRQQIRDVLDVVEKRILDDGAQTTYFFFFIFCGPKTLTNIRYDCFMVSMTMINENQSWHILSLKELCE